MKASNSYLISDIHGCSKTFQFLLHEKLKFSEHDTLYILGDFIDRGPDSKGVLDECMLLINKWNNVHLLRGNHEQLMLESIHSSSSERVWLSNGGDKALESFGCSSINTVNRKYLDLVNSMKYYIELERFILVHAGLNFSIKKPFTDKEAMLWSRFPEVKPKKIGGKGIIHGHTPYELSVIINQNINVEKAICLDAGCVWKGIKSGMGHLVALELNSGNFHYTENID